MKRSIPLIVAMAFTPALAFAQTVPNMLSTWKIESSATWIGSGAPHLITNNKNTDIQFSKPTLTLVIDRQEGINFAGTLSSTEHKEVILGAITPDFQGGVMVSDNGTHTFKIVNSNTIQNCYVQISKPKVAACWTGTRQ